MTRFGIGYDSHRLAPGRPLILGGVEVPSEAGPEGHSDADVLTHAIIDALLGAAGRGDIGERFPDSDPAYAGADSIELLRTVVAELAAAGFAIANVDATLAIERPKLADHKRAMSERLADALDNAVRAEKDVKDRKADLDAATAALPAAEEAQKAYDALPQEAKDRIAAERQLERLRADAASAQAALAAAEGN